MNRRAAALSTAATAVVVIIAWQEHAHYESPPPAAPAHPRARIAAPAPPVPASIAGTITDDAHAPLANARVCARPIEQREPTCTTSDAAGHYTLAGVPSGRLELGAALRGYIPSRYAGGDDPDQPFASLGAGEHRTGVDFVLVHGGAVLTGSVGDIGGGPIAHALVRDEHGAYAECGDDGRFELWTALGYASITASADGYVDHEDQASVPGALRMTLTPEATLAGTVVDAASGEPVAGVRVTAVVARVEDLVDRGTSATSDERGRFQIRGLLPDRYSVVARAPHGYGHSNGSYAIGFAQHVGDVAVKLYPAARVAGRMVLPDASHSTCTTGRVVLARRGLDRRIELEPDRAGTFAAEAVATGHYAVEASCSSGGFATAALDVADHDLTGLEWSIATGTTITGRLATRAGTPIAGETIYANAIQGTVTTRSSPDGSYRLDRLTPGTWTIHVSPSEHGAAIHDGVVIASGDSEIHHDLIPGDIGTLDGSIVDRAGKPLAAVYISALAPPRSFGYATSSEDGHFHIGELPPGTYALSANRGAFATGLLPVIGNTTATIRAGTTSHIELVVDVATGTIKGTVVGPDGPASGVLVTAQLESDQRSDVVSGFGPVTAGFAYEALTASDGSFTLSELAPGAYTIDADRERGAHADHVAVGSTIALHLARTGSISGVARLAGRAPDELDVTVYTKAMIDEHHASFFHSDGAFTIGELPAGHYTIDVRSPDGNGQTTIDLAEGEAKAADVELIASTTVVGRVVDVATHAPVAGIVMSAPDIARMKVSHDRDATTGADGRFELHDAPRGDIWIFGRDNASTGYGGLRCQRHVDAVPRVDIGEIKIARPRVGRGEPLGRYGIQFDRDYSIAEVEPDGPAAAAGLRAGDRVVAVDGTEITGDNCGAGDSLLRAPPGAVVKLGLARGVTVAITLGPPATPP